MIKIMRIRKETCQKNRGSFSDLLHKPGWSNRMINKYLSDWLTVVTMCVVNKTLFMLIFIQVE
jgi:hypothetical protein